MATQWKHETTTVAVASVVTPIAHTISVDGMSCEHCEQTVEEPLETVDGVEQARADRDAGVVTVDDTAATATLHSVLEDAGYKVVD